MTDQTPEELRPALPDLPKLASELTGITDAADLLYDDPSGSVS